MKHSSTKKLMIEYLFYYQTNLSIIIEIENIANLLNSQY